MKSMTGYGIGRAALGQGTLNLEVRALNHKNQDVRLRLPTELAEHQFYLEELVRKNLGRGRFDVALRVQGAIGGEPQISFEKARAHYAALTNLRDEIAPESEVPFTALLKFPGIFQESSLEPDLARSSLKTAFDEAHRQLDEMRNSEGQRLAVDFNERLEIFASLIEKITESAAAALIASRLRLKNRLAELLEGTKAQVAPERLEAELAVLAERSDITEELVRLESHRVELARLFSQTVPIGRKVDFLLQEVGREVNTIGSKSHDATIAHLVVNLKAEVERMREQVQNIE